MISKKQQTLSFEEAIEKVNTDDSFYRVVTDDENLKVLERHDQDQGLSVVKAEGIVNVPVDAAYQLLNQQDLRNDWDDFVNDFDIFSPIDDWENFNTWWFQEPHTNTKRDVVTKRKAISNYKGYDYVIITNSEDHSERPVNDGVIRDEIINSITLLKSEGDNKTRFVILNNVNLNHDVPVEEATRIACEYPGEFLKLVEKGYGKHKHTLQ